MDNNQQNTNRKSLVKTGTILAIMLVLTYGVSLLLGNLSGEFTNQSTFQTQSYYQWYVYGFLVIFILSVVYTFTRSGDKTYGNSLFFANQGEFPSLPIGKRFGIFQFSFLLFILILGIFTFVVFVKPQTSYLPTVSQQFTATTATAYDLSLIPGAENIGLAVLVFGLGSFLIGRRARKKEWSPVTFAVVSWVALILGSGVYGYLNHLLNPLYAASTVTLDNILAIWLVIGLLVVITGSFIVGWEVHFINNLVYDLQRIQSIGVSGTRTILLISLIVLIVAYVLIYAKNKRWFGTSNKLVQKQENVIYT